MNYRPQLNGYFPRDMIQQEYRKHLPSDLTVDGVGYTSNQSVEDLLNNTSLMNSIRFEMHDAFIAKNQIVNDDDNTTPRPHHKPSKDIDDEY